MTDGQTYYDGLIAQGYPAEQALGYTQQYYPGFTPAASAPAPIPAPAPVQAQPVVQPQAIPQPQPMAQTMAQPMAQTIPMQQPMMNTTPVGMAPMGMAPVGIAPIGEKKPIMAWAAVSCIVLALILTCAGQFGNSWLVQSEDDVESGAAQISIGLSSMVADCAGVTQEDECIAFSYIILAAVSYTHLTLPTKRIV